jgi:hypothetical protein
MVFDRETHANGTDRATGRNRESEAGTERYWLRARSSETGLITPIQTNSFRS